LRDHGAPDTKFTIVSSLPIFRGEVAHLHVDRQSAARLAVEDVDRTNGRFRLGDVDVASAVVPHQNDVVVEIDRRVLRERAADAKSIEYFHSLRRSHVVLAGDGYSSSRQQRVAEYDRRNRLGVRSGAAVVERQRAEIVMLDESVERERRACRRRQIVVRALRHHVQQLAEFLDSLVDLRLVADCITQSSQFVNLDQLDVRAERYRNLSYKGTLGIDRDHLVQNR
jgi:hypothetical protein